MSLSTFLDSLSISNVRQDKVELSIGEWTVDAIDSEMTGFLRYLGDREAHQRRNVHSAFQLDARIGQNESRVRVAVLSSKRGRGYREMAPLFGGYLNAKRISQSEGNDRYVLSLKLSVNPTRFCVYQPTPYRTEVGGERQLPIQPVLFATQDSTSYKGEESLDNNDNVILSPPARLNASNNFWERNFQRYLTGIVNYIDEELIAYLSQGFTVRNFEERYSLRYVENYWDIPCDDAVELVHRFLPSFSALANNSSLQFYPVNGVSIDQTSPSLKGEFRNGEKLKIYAKTPQRIRVEVEHTPPKNPSLMPERRYSTTDLSQLFFLFNSLSQDAHSLTDTFVRALWEHSSLANLTPSSGLHFIREFYSSVDDSQLANQLITLFSTQGGISSSSISNEWRDTLNDLCGLGLVERKGRPINKYVVAPRFLRAIQGLSSSSGAMTF